MSDAALLQASEASRIFGGRYALRAVLREAACGAVHDAIELGPQLRVGLTVLSTSAAQVTFRRWQSAMLGASWRCFPNLRDETGAADGAVYFATESIRGEKLDRVLARDGPFTLASAARLVLDVCADLEQAGSWRDLCHAVQPEEAFIWRDEYGVAHIQLTWLGLFAASSTDAENEHRLLVTLLANLVGVFDAANVVFKLLLLFPETQRSLPSWVFARP